MRDKCVALDKETNIPRIRPISCAYTSYTLHKQARKIRCGYRGHTNPFADEWPIHSENQITLSKLVVLKKRPIFRDQMDDICIPA